MLHASQADSKQWANLHPKAAEMAKNGDSDYAHQPHGSM